MAKQEENLYQVLQSVSEIAVELNEADCVEKIKKITDLYNSDVLSVGIIGSTNSGKSTTLNALLRGEFLPVSNESTTAHVLRIKHNPEISESRLMNSSECVATGEEEICTKLKDFNIMERKGINGPAQPQNLELQVPFSLFRGKRSTSDFKLEMYDCPGTSEDTSSRIVQVAQQLQCKVEGIILVLSQDTYDHQSTKDLLETLRKQFPLMMERKGQNRCLVLMNKYDQFFTKGKTEFDERKKQDISEKIGAPVLCYYSADYGFNARKWKENPSVVEKKQFRLITSELAFFPDPNGTIEKKLDDHNQFNAENVEELSAEIERVSCINEVEDKIIESLSCLKHLKAVDDTKAIVSELLQSKIKISEGIKKKLEDIGRYLEDY